MQFRSTARVPQKLGCQARWPAHGQEMGQTQFARTQRTLWRRGDCPVLEEAPRALGPCQCRTVPALTSRGRCVSRLNPALGENHCWGKAGWIPSPPGRRPTHDWPRSQPTRHPQSFVGARSPCYLVAWSPGSHPLVPCRTQGKQYPPPRSGIPRDPCSACTEMRCLPPARRGRPLSLQWTPGPPLGGWVLHQRFYFTDRVAVGDVQSSPGEALHFQPLVPQRSL